LVLPLSFFLASLASAASFPNENQRLVEASRLWVTVEYFHPSVAHGSIDWEAAFVAAIPKIRSAATQAEYAAAISAMLSAVHDPSTCVLSGPFGPATTFKDETTQRSVAQTAFQTSLLIDPIDHFPETITLDLSGIKVMVRLSEPESSIPVPPASAPQQFNDPYPSTEGRLLAAAKTWGAIRYFFAYKDLMDDDWDDLFAAALPKFIAAKDALGYNLTLADLLTHLTDSQTVAHSRTLDQYFGEAPVGLRLRMLDKHPVIVSVLDPAATAAGIQPGDIVKRVDGESIVDRFNKQVAYVDASTPQRSSFDTLQRILNGPAGSKVTLTIETPSGETKTATLDRSSSYQSAPQRTSEPVQLLSNDIGYLDLDRLSPSEALAAMGRLHECKGLILDLRGKSIAAQTIAARLASQPETPAAIITTPLALHPDVATPGIATQTASTFLVQTLTSAGVPGFKGKTVALIDERTIGDSEQAGLLFEAANKTEFIGSPSAGANSELASFSLPGGITVSYSARDIRHANGGKLQRLGLQPNGAAPETAKSIHDGKDAPLEAARVYLSR
jgi:C-terminal processing protease CtpA/Prc